MSQFAGVLTPPRRNPRRAAATTGPTTGPTTRPTAPTARVTRASARLLSGYATDGSNSGDDEADDDPDDVDSDSDSEDELSMVPDPTFTQPRQSRQASRLKTIASTRERRYATGHGPSRATRAVAIRQPSRRQDPSTPRKTNNKSDSPTKAGSARKKSPVRDQPSWPTSNVIPPWEKLEWTILVKVFEYAGYPQSSKSNVRWLLSAGLTCKTFLGPALKALYKCPMPQIISLNTGNKFANLIRELASDAGASAALARQDHRRTMVESLVVEVSSLPIHSQTRNFDIGELILSLPSLSYVELYHDHDLPPYRRLDLKNKKWTYTTELLDAIKLAGDGEAALRLKTWKWSERMMASSFHEQLQTIHGWNTFSYLRNLTLVNFQVPSLDMQEKDVTPEVIAEDNAYIKLVASSLAPIAGLEHLVLESSTLVDGQFLSLLPKTIEHLEIINCWEVTADMLSEYLATHGQNFRRLTLLHNQSLNLTFLPVLGEHCPKLRELNVDLLTFNHHEYYKDSDPFYDHLLTADHVPHWPETMQVIEIEQMDKWDLPAAEVFFQSFVDQAHKLPQLRHLAVKARLDVPWRQRSEFRDRWVRKLKSVFVAKTPKPRPFHSLIQWPLDGEANRQAKFPNPKKQGEGEDAEVAPPRRSTRVVPRVVAPAPPPASSEGNRRKRKRSLTSAPRDLRQRKRVDLSYRDPDTDDDLDLEESSEDDEEDAQQDPMHLSSPPASPSPSALSEDGAFVHGLCEVVNIRFDNEKPREFRYAVEDFLDEQTQNSSDDAEWTSDREMDDDDDNYAW